MKQYIHFFVSVCGFGAVCNAFVHTCHCQSLASYRILDFIVPVPSRLGIFNLIGILSSSCSNRNTQCINHLDDAENVEIVMS